MLELDEFESAFKSASKQRYERSIVAIERVLVVTDLDGGDERLYTKDVEGFLGSVVGDAVDFTGIGAAAYEDAGQLLGVVEGHRPDVICTYRNLLGRARRFPFSLGAHVDVLTQATTTPVLLLPPPTEEGRLAASCGRAADVMVLTDHLTGSDRLVDWGVRLTDPKGTLFLVHLEDDVTFQRYLDVISKVPSIDTDTAREDIAAQLLKEPADYIQSIREALAAEQVAFHIESVVEMGHRVEDVKRLVKEHSADLLVMNTKDDEQLAMHGLAYPLAVELRHLPLLML